MREQLITINFSWQLDIMKDKSLSHLSYFSRSWGFFWRTPEKKLLKEASKRKNLIFLDSWCPEIDKEHHFSLFFADLMQRRVTSSCRRNLEVKWSGQVQKLQSFMHLWRQSSSMYIIFIGPLNNGRAHDKSSRGCGFESQRLLGFSFLFLSILPYFP